MAKLSAEERAELEARLRDDDDDDESDEVEVGRSDGSYFKGSYRRARKLGYVSEPAAKTDGKKSGGQGEEPKRFAGRRV